MQENQASTPDQSPEQRSTQPSVGTMTGVKKRQQIKDINKKTFLWLAISAVIVSVCLVAMQFLVREFMFNQKIINKKSETNKTLANNVMEAEKLRENINKLLADPKLSSLKYETPNVETTALNVILDALPIEGDPTDFANSLQAVVLPRSGVSVKSLGTASTADAAGLEDTPAVAGALPSEVSFTAGFAGNYQKTQSTLIDISRVIRPINVKMMTLSATGDNELLVALDGVTYYLPAKKVEIRKETIKP